MTDTRLLSWTGVLKNKVKRKSHRVSKQVFDGKTEQDIDYDETFAELPDEVCENISMKISSEFHKRVINLSNENIRGVAAATVGTCLRTSPCVRLNLSHNFIRCQDVELIIKHLNSETTNLEDLDLSNNRIEENGANLIAKMLQENKTLQRLNLDTNGIEQGIEQLAGSLATNTTLVSFSISWNNLSFFAEEFYLAIIKNRTLQCVSMGYCQLNDSFADHLATGLTINRTLKELILFGNQISDEGALKFAQALEENISLNYLNLDNNLLGDEGAGALLNIVHRKEEASFELTVNVRQNEVSAPLLKRYDAVRRKQLRRKTELVIEGGLEEDDSDSYTCGSSRHNTVTEFFNNRFYQMNVMDEDDGEEENQDNENRYDD